jgi:copper chaperone CopZ
MSTALESENQTTITAAGDSMTSERVTIPLTGMTCAACQSFIQRTLTNEPGVQDAAVNLMLHNATVTFDPRVISTSWLVEAIRHTGASEASPPLTKMPNCAPLSVVVPFLLFEHRCIQDQCSQAPPWLSVLSV